MQVNQVSAVNFEGKIIYSKKMTKPMIDYANEILDVVIEGRTARERIKEASYDLYIKKDSSKKAIHPKIFFESYYMLLNDPYKHCKYSGNVRIDSPKIDGARELDRFLSNFEQSKNWFKDSYNTFWEKILAFLNF